MNNISGFIQPTMFPQPSIVGIMPQSVPMVTSGGRTEIMTMVIISVIVVMVLFMLYKNMYLSNNEDIESMDNNEKDKKSKFESQDPLTKCGWEVIISDGCPYCIQQKETLSRYFPNFKSIYNNKPAEVVPTWHNIKTGQILPGYQNYNNLINMISACQ